MDSRDTLPASSKKVARALWTASGRKPAIVLANLSGFDGSPESLRNLQLEFGAQIGRAVVNFKGPLIFCVVSRYHGGAYVVFSRELNPSLQALALSGSFASVIGGAPAAAVVFPGLIKQRVAADPEVVAAQRHARSRLCSGACGGAGTIEQILREAHSRAQGAVAREFDAVHTVERAHDVGSIEAILSPSSFAPSSSAGRVADARGRRGPYLARCAPSCGRTWTDGSGAKPFSARMNARRAIASSWITRQLYLAAHALVGQSCPGTHRWRRPTGAFEKNSYGRPEINGAWPIRFNLSHTRGLVACLVVRTVDAGVDVEHRRELRDRLKVAERFFSPIEVRELKQLPVEEQPRRFYELWTLKESYIKARGMGLAIPLDQFSYRFAATPVLTTDPAHQDNGADWQCGLASPTDEHQLAWAVRNSGRPLAVRISAFPPEALALPAASR